MTKKLSTKDTALVVMLLILLIGVGYYMLFLTPLKNELSSISSQSADLDNQISVAAAKIGSMNDMQAELDEIFARPSGEVTEIAEYDNKKAVYKELSSILSSCTDTKITFADPKFGDDGIVRRNVTLNFTCPNYSSAKTIIKKLTKSQWRCMIGSISVSGDGSISSGPVTCAATITFFESQNIGE